MVLQDQLPSVKDLVSQNHSNNSSVWKLRYMTNSLMWRCGIAEDQLPDVKDVVWQDQLPGVKDVVSQD